MRLDKVMDEVAKALTEITGLQMFAYPPESLTPPAGYLAYPQSVDFDEAYQRGEDRFTDLPVVLLASKVTTRAARDTVAAWASGDGPKSVKRALEAPIRQRRVASAVARCASGPLSPAILHEIPAYRNAAGAHGLPVATTECWCCGFGCATSRLVTSKGPDGRAD